MGKQFKRKPTNKKLTAPPRVKKLNKNLKETSKHIYKVNAEGNNKNGGSVPKYEGIDLERVYKLALLGMTNQELSEFFKVSQSQFSKWVNGDMPGLAQAIEMGRVGAAADVASRLIERAKGYEHDDEEIKIVSVGENQGSKVVRVPVRKYYPPDTAAAQFVLKNLRPKNWKDKPVEDLNPEILAGGTNVVVLTDPDKIAELIKRKNERKDNAKD